MNSNPLVSVIMNCYNGSQFLEKSIKSVLGQSYKNWELIVWDNLSTDNSSEVINRFTDPRIRYFVSETHTMLSPARNSAISMSQGELIAFLDVDDWWEPSKLDKQVPLFHDEEVGLACSNFWIFNQNQKTTKVAYSSELPSGRQLSNLLEKYTVALPTLIVRETAIKDLHFAFNPEYHIIGDFDLVIRLSSSWKISRHSEPLATYRIHGGNESLKKITVQTSEIELWVQRNALVPDVGNNPKFPLVSANLYFNLGLNARKNGDYIAALKTIYKIKSPIRMFKFLICLILPRKVLMRKFS